MLRAHRLPAARICLLVAMLAAIFGSSRADASYWEGSSLPEVGVSAPVSAPAPKPRAKRKKPSAVRRARCAAAARAGKHPKAHKACAGKKPKTGVTKRSVSPKPAGTGPSSRPSVASPGISISAPAVIGGPPPAEALQPVEEPKLPVEEPIPPVEEPKPPVEEPKPPVEEPKPPVEEPKPPVEEEKAKEEKAAEEKAQEIKAKEVKAKEEKAAEEKASEEKAQEVKTEEEKANEKKAQEVKVEEERTREEKAREVKAQEEKVAEERAEALKAEEEKAQEERARGVKAQEEQAQEEKAREEKVAEEQKLREEKATEEKANEEKAREVKAEEEKAKEEKAKEEAAAPFRFFSPTSFWNEELPAGVPLDPSSAGVVDAFDEEIGQAEVAKKSLPTINTISWSTPIYTVPASQPMVEVTLYYGVSAALQAAWSAVPLPADAQPAVGSDKNLVVWQPSTDRMWEFWGLEQTDEGWQAAWGGAMEDVTTNFGVYGPEAWQGAASSWGASASSLPIAGGLITLEDLEKGEINHALAIGVPNVREGVYASPAQRTDGKSTIQLSLPEGAHLRLDPSLDLASLHLPRLTLMMAEAAQRYGIFVRDKASNVAFYGQDPTPTGTNPYAGAHGYYEGKSPAQLLESFPWKYLQLLKMNLHSTS